MKALPPFLTRLFIAAGIACALPAQAEPLPDGMREHCTAPMIPPHAHTAMMRDSRLPMLDMLPPSSGPIPPFLHGVTLTEAQQDKVFSILYDAAPLLRKQGMLARKSADAMRNLATSGQYDEAMLTSLADSNARAMTETLSLHVRSAHRIYALLTQEQRAQIEKAQCETFHE